MDPKLISGVGAVDYVEEFSRINMALVCAELSFLSWFQLFAWLSCIDVVEEVAAVVALICRSERGQCLAEVRWYGISVCITKHSSYHLAA